jgi:hypothetical protein
MIHLAKLTVGAMSASGFFGMIAGDGEGNIRPIRAYWLLVESRVSKRYRQVQE